LEYVLTFAKDHMGNGLSETLTINLTEALVYSLDVMNKIMDQNIQALNFKGTTIESAYSLMKIVILDYFKFLDDTSISNVNNQ
jgi:hypothetical protein